MRSDREGPDLTDDMHVAASEALSGLAQPVPERAMPLRQLISCILSILHRVSRTRITYRWLLVGILVWAGAMPAQGRTVTVVAPDGTRVAEYRVSLSGRLPAACATLGTRGGVATIVIPIDELNRLADRDEHAIENRISRVDFLASGRARDLLKLLSTDRDSRGCKRLRGELAPDTSYLIGWLLEQGRVLVFTRNLNLPEPAIVVRHVDGQVSGYEVFALVNGTVFWSYGVWVS